MRRTLTLTLAAVAAFGCQDETPARVGIGPAEHGPTSFEVNLSVKNAAEEDLKVPGTLAVRMLHEGEELCRWEPTPVTEADYEFEFATVILPGECDAPPRPGAHMDYRLAYTFTLPDGTPLTGETAALYTIGSRDDATAAAPGDAPPADAPAPAGDRQPTEAPTAAVTGVLVATPHPVRLRAPVGARVQPDPSVPGVVQIVGGPCPVSIAEGRDDGRPVSGARVREMLGGSGAQFTSSEVSDEGWALAYTWGGKRSVHHGIVTDGKAYVCRGDFTTAEEQACGAALCATMEPTGGAAAAAPSGDFVAHCDNGPICTEVRSDVRAALDPTCAMVRRPIAEGGCAPTGPAGAARLGTCESRGLRYVYYAGGTHTADSARAQCAQLGGSFAAGP